MEAVFETVRLEEKRQTEGVELIASENYVSPNVIKAMGSVFTNKYAEGYPGRRYYGGCEYADKVENLAITYAKKLYSACYVNVQPHSGSHANMAVMMSVLNPGDKILGLSLNDGGHLTHGSPVSFSGILYEAHHYGLDVNGYVNYDAVEKKALEVVPKLIICGASAYSREWDYKRLRKIANKIDAILLADISHTSGLIVSGLLSNPINDAHIVTTTTHKTLRGPRGGLIMLGKDFDNPKGVKRKGVVRKMSEMLDFTIFPVTSGGPHMHTIAAKAVALSEAMDDTFKSYSKQVVRNSQAMAYQLQKLGYDVVSGGTDNHMFLIDLSNKGVSGKTAEKALEKAGITVNKNMVPNDKRSPFVTSGIRVGTAAITTRGLKDEDCRKIVTLMDRVLSNPKDDQNLSVIKQEVVSMMSSYPLFQTV